MALSDAQIKAGVQAAADQLEATVRAHERADHGGETCVNGRVNLAASIAYALGMRADDLASALMFALALADLDREARDTAGKKKPRRKD